MDDLNSVIVLTNPSATDRKKRWLATQPKSRKNYYVSREKALEERYNFPVSPAFMISCLMILVIGLSTTIISALVVIILQQEPVLAKPCTDDCRISLVESIPENLTYPDGSPIHMSTYEAWQSLINVAERSIDIASFYWTLRSYDVPVVDPTSWQGEAIFQALQHAGMSPGMRVRIAQSTPEKEGIINDTEILMREGAATVKSLDFQHFMGGGVLHTKMWIVDNKHVYIGSANMDWRSLTQIKEMGVLINNCTCLAKDLSKIFSVYWDMGGTNTNLPYEWPSAYQTLYNIDSPMKLMLNDTTSHVYASSAPFLLCPEGRTPDLEAILDIIDQADKYIDIAVMDYFPLIVYTYPQKYWSEIDDQLRKAAFDRKVTVRVMASIWNSTTETMVVFLKSLASLNDTRDMTVEVKLFYVPSFTEEQRELPYARVNHNKYMVTEKTAYIGTSNWSGDYFYNTGGVGLIINQENSTLNQYELIQKQLRDVFNRDWDSPYSLPLNSSTPISAFCHFSKHIPCD